MGIFNLFTRHSRSRKLERFLGTVYDYGPNVLDNDVFSVYPNIITSHHISEVANLTRVAVLDACLHVQLFAFGENFFDEFNSLRNNVFSRLQDRFDLYMNAIRDFENISYPNLGLIKFARQTKAPFDQIYVMCIDSAWLFTRLVPDYEKASKDVFITTVTKNILQFCEFVSDSIRF